jgi:hypothetical protein
MPKRTTVLVSILLVVAVISAILLLNRPLLDKVANIGKNTNPAPGRMCTLIGCNSGATIYFDSPVSFAELQKSTANFCQNSKCFNIYFDNIKAPPQPETGLYGHSDGNEANGMISTDKNGKIYIQLDWGGETGTKNDTYSADLINSQGKSIYSVEKVVNYNVSYPNGKECGPTCYRGVIDERLSPN